MCMKTIATTCWTLWQERNFITFKGKTWDLQPVIKAPRSTAIWWTQAPKEFKDVAKEYFDNNFSGLLFSKNVKIVKTIKMVGSCLTLMWVLRMKDRYVGYEELLRDHTGSIT
ncbi:hypothetical protein AMTR_s00019p00116000 [Amborella trichopoda]|uniref:Uncharacterized protein n=1 Tax=Amborella trichopoda TaxID=13333 RepID=W1PGM1_AMBTC|nr:hypothetical protein AMTR_s00019p00116000 [Amborella trichopoda]